MEASLQSVSSLQNTLQNDISILSAAHQTLISSNNIAMYTTTSSSSMYGLNQATQQMIAKAFQVQNKPLTNIVYSDSDVFFVQ